MEWLKVLNQSIEYMEEHLTENINAEDVAANVYLSGFYLQKGFKVVTGMTMGEYIRNRRLYMAALDLLDNQKVIDVAYKYSYETPESFSKAFSRFHGISPAQIKKQRYRLRTFLPLQIKI